MRDAETVLITQTGNSTTQNVGIPQMMKNVIAADMFAVRADRTHGRTWCIAEREYIAQHYTTKTLNSGNQHITIK